MSTNFCKYGQAKLMHACLYDKICPAWINIHETVSGLCKRTSEWLLAFFYKSWNVRATPCLHMEMTWGTKFVVSVRFLLITENTQNLTQSPPIHCWSDLPHPVVNISNPFSFMESKILTCNQLSCIFYCRCVRVWSYCVYTYILLLFIRSDNSQHLQLYLK